jgi:hypothetical protein
MKRIVGFLLLLTAISSCSAQYKLVKAQAFFTASMPGMAMQDENGNIIDPKPIIDRFIYIECRFNDRPKVDTVFYNGLLLKAVVADKEETTTAIGIKKSSGIPINIIPKRGNHVWRIDLQQINADTLKHEAVKKIVIKGRLAKTKFSYKLSTETELAAPERY